MVTVTRVYVNETAGRDVLVKDQKCDSLRDNDVPALWSPPSRRWSTCRTRVPDLVACLQLDGDTVLPKAVSR